MRDLRYKEAPHSSLAVSKKTWSGLEEGQKAL
jgi:hypothetical protein